MSKSRSQKRKASGPRVTGETPAALFRFAVLDEVFRDHLDANILAKASAAQIAKQGGELLDAATSPREVVEALPRMRAVALRKWEMRARLLPPEEGALRLAEVLDELYTWPEDDRRERLYDSVIGALRWLGDPGAEALRTRLPGLPPSAGARACVALGLIGTEDDIPRLKGWYLAQREQLGHDYAGALWGLADLGAPAVNELLLEEFYREDRLPELAELCAFAGDERLLLPLMVTAHQQARQGESDDEALSAMYAIYWRVGRERFEAAFSAAEASPETARKLAELFEARPPAMQSLEDPSLAYTPVPEESE